MDPNRFDDLAKALATGTSRRRILQGLGGTIAALGSMSRFARVMAAPGGNSDCAHFCAAAFPPGPQRGQCISDGAHGVGPCVDCGGDIARYCDGACVDLTTIDNCGACNNVCQSPDACHTPVCANGACGTTPTVDFTTDVKNCGTCGNACTSDSCDTPICTDGTCGLSPTVDFASDVSNCGTCGNVCHGDDCNDATCSGGVCGKTPANDGGLCDNNAGTCTSGTCDESCTPNGGACSGPSGTCCSGYCEHASGGVYTTPGICKPCSPLGTPCNGLHCCNGGNCFHASGNLNDAGICCKSQGDSCTVTSDCCSGYCDGSYCRGGLY